MYNKNSWFKLVLFTMVVVGYNHNLSAQKNKPNIIYILADDLGYGDIAAFNENGKIKTPNIDKLASEGMKFTDAHTSSSVCTPTRYGIITGRYNWRTSLKAGVLNGTSTALIPNSKTTIASMLKKQGYNTAFIGKWHLGWDWKRKGKKTKGFDAFDYSKPIKNGPNELGFDYSYGFCGSLDMAPYIYVENGLATEKELKITKNTREYSHWREGPTGMNFNHELVTPHFFEKAISYIGDQKNKKEPFFLYLPLPSPHTPILPTKEWQNKSGLNPYGDFVMMLDAYVGKLLKSLKDSGLDKNTLVVFTSDNGCSNQANFNLLEKKGHYPSYKFKGLKTQIYEGGHRVPFIVKWPGKIKPNTTSNQIVCTTDFLATCAEITNYKLQDNEGEDSFSMLPELLQEKSDKPIRTSIVHHSVAGEFAIKKGDWKLIMCQDAGSDRKVERDERIDPNKPLVQLFNLKEDIGEENNMAESHKDIVADLTKELIHLIDNGRSTPGKKQQNDPIDFEWKQVWFK